MGFKTLQIFNWDTLTLTPESPFDPITNPHTWEFSGPGTGVLVPTPSGDGTFWPVQMSLPEFCIWMRRVNNIVISWNYQVHGDPLPTIGSISCDAGCIDPNFGDFSEVNEATCFLTGTHFDVASGGDGEINFGVFTKLLHKGTGHDSELEGWFPSMQIRTGILTTNDGGGTLDLVPFDLQIDASDPVDGNVYTNSSRLYCSPGTTFDGGGTITMSTGSFWPYTTDYTT